MGSKQIISNNSLPDRISDLPSDITGFILDRLPIRDAVATSILSKDWRHKWRTIGNLIFDGKFADDVISPRIKGKRRRQRIILEYGNIIGRILLLHLGPIRKFVLSIPYFGYTLPFDLLSSWICFISHNEVKELTFEAPNVQISLPSYLFHCDELQHLKLEIDTLDVLPQDFKGFCNLISLELSAFEDFGFISDLISRCPLLERLSLEVTFFRYLLVFDAPRLRFLKTCFGMIVNKLLKLKDVHSVTDISLNFNRDTMDFCYLISIFGSMPRLETVILYPPTTLLDMPPDAPISLPTTLHNLKSLILLDVDFAPLECIYFVLCVLNSSPNLQMLNLGILPSETSDHEDADEDALHFLDMQTREIQTLKCLLTVKIKGLFGNKTEVMLLKLILSCSPVLKTMFLMGKDTRYSRLGKDILLEVEFTLMTELLQCPRSSTRAQVIYSRPPGDNSLFDF